MGAGSLLHPTVKAYITKHALTEGVIEVEATVSPRSAQTISVGEGYNIQHFHTPDWHEDRQMAIMAARAMRMVAVKKLEAEVERLKALVFE